MKKIKLTKDSIHGLLDNLLKRSPNNYGQYADAVNEIVEAVKKDRDQAVFAYTKKFDGANLTVTGSTTLTGNTEASGGTIALGDDTHTTTIKGSILSVSSPAPLEFSPSVKVSASTDGTNPLFIEPGKISRTGDKNNLSIEAPNTTITSTVKSLIKGAAVEVVDSTNSGGLISGVDSVGATTLFGNSSVGISSSTGSVSLSSGTTMNLEGGKDVSIKSTGGELKLGQAGNATNINGSKITLTHDSSNSVDVISKLVVKESASGDGVEITKDLIKGANSNGLKMESLNLTVQGSTSVGIKSPSISAGPVSGDNQVTINTTTKSLTVNNASASIITSDAVSIEAKQITLTSTGSGDAGKTVVTGGLSVVGGAEVDTLNATTSLTTPKGNIDVLISETGNITNINSTQAAFSDQITISDIVIRYDSLAKALIFETAGA